MKNWQVCEGNLDTTQNNFDAFLHNNVDNQFAP